MAVYERNLREFDMSTLTASPQDIGLPLDFPVFGATFVNTSTVGVYIGDGSTRDDIKIPANSTYSVAGVTNPNGGQVKSLFQAGAQLTARQDTAAAAGELIINMAG